jgi:hypothetical protein
LWERTARTKILEQSTSPPRIRGADVADAIEALVGRPERRSLPVAFDKNAIVQKLVEIAHTDEDGIVHEQTTIAARCMTETFLNRLSIAGRCPLSPHKRRKSGHFLTADHAELGHSRGCNLQFRGTGFMERGAAGRLTLA